MAFMFSDSFDELESTRLSLKVLTKEPGNEKEIPMPPEQSSAALISEVLLGEP